MSPPLHYTSALLPNLNDTNGDSEKLFLVHRMLLKTFPNEHIYAAEFGVAYGGGLRVLASCLGSQGSVYGFDTFEGHPKDVALDGHDSPEAVCMDGWYRDMGMAKLKDTYISTALHQEGLDNVTLIKGLVHSTCANKIPKLHYAFLDLDMIEPMKDAYVAVKDKIVPLGFLCVHDIYPSTHLGGKIHKWWHKEIMPQGRFREWRSLRGKHLGVFQKIK